MDRPALWPLVSLLVLGAACVGAEDNPSNVHDLRVLGVKLEPPELMAPTCAFTPEALAVFSAQVRYTALIADPAGEGRALHFELFACASPSDRTCSAEEDRILLGSGDVAPAASRTWLELGLLLRPGVLQLPDRTALLQRVLELDTYQGLGGIRLPLVLHLTAGAEEIWASKLMVFSCAYFPESGQNVNPVLPGVRLNNVPWGEGDVPVLGGGPFEVTPEDFAALQEPYVVPALDLSKVELSESWRLSWYADLGTFSPGNTGGADPGGGEGRHRTEWRPPREASEQDVHFWFVVRDGRGGLTWLARTAHYRP